VNPNLRYEFAAIRGYALELSAFVRFAISLILGVGSKSQVVTLAI
jgi:hypothetical protein